MTNMFKSQDPLAEIWISRPSTLSSHMRKLCSKKEYIQ